MESAVPPDVSRTASEGRLPFLSNVNAVSDDVAERVTIEHRHLRSAIEFAVAIADAGQRLRPPLAYPADLKPYLKSPRVPSSALGKLRRAIESDDRFRRRLAAGVVDELVDPIGQEWLRREEGWPERVAELIAEQEREASEADAAAALRRAEKRRDAAEQVAARTRAELIALRDRVDELTRQLTDARHEVAARVAETERAQSDLAATRQAERHARDRAQADRDRVAAVEAARDDALTRAATAEAQRDALLAERAERAGTPVSADQVGEVRELARLARGVAERLEGLVVTPTPRRALALPGGVARESTRATEHLLRSGAVVFIDGYNVAKLAWPDAELAEQRERCLDVADDLARRLGTELVVVFDGADVVGSHARTRRLVRVTYSPAGIIADDVIRAEVAAVPPTRPVVVVTNDQAVRRDVAAAGGNVVSSDAFLALALARPA